MGMATIQFYRNKYNYPKYSTSITAYGSSMLSTPVGINLKSGKLRVIGNMSDFMSCNYIKITRDTKTIYGWIDDVEFHTDNSFYVSYTVDGWRTYRSKINLGIQYIERSPTETNKLDNLLGSTKETNDITRWEQNIGVASERYAVVQIRSEINTIVSASNTPVQPSPYQFYFCKYPVNNWQSASPIKDLLQWTIENPENPSIVTMYSLPYVDLSGMEKSGVPLGGTGGSVIAGWYRLASGQTMTGKLTTSTEINDSFPSDLYRVNHNVMLVIPEAGVINIPDELLFHKPLYLRQDIDLFSGACNYMVTALGTNRAYHLSARGSSLSTIPILSDPYDTYISQNQNALTTSLIGDVASLGLGAMALKANPMVGASMLANAGLSISSTIGGIEDASNKGYSNPPSFLGTALASSYHQKFWVVVIKTNVNNKDIVNSNFGYPYNKVDDLVFPSSGFIQTKGCSVSSTDGSVPRWAIEEINNNFDRGILVKTS